MILRLYVHYPMMISGGALYVIAIRSSGLRPLRYQQDAGKYRELQSPATTKRGTPKSTSSQAQERTSAGTSIYSPLDRCPAGQYYSRETAGRASRSTITDIVNVMRVELSVSARREPSRCSIDLSSTTFPKSGMQS